MKTRVLYPKNIWYNKSFAKLSPVGKVLAIYLVTNSNIGLTNIYEQKDLEMQFLLGLNEQQLEKIKQELTERGLFYFKDEWVFIDNNFSYCDYFGRDRIMQSKQKELSSIPVDIIEYFKGLKRGYEGVSNPLLNNKPKIINHKSKIINQKEGGMGETKKINPYLEKFNEITGRNLRILDPKAERQIKELEQNGYGLEDWCSAVKNAMQDKFLVGKNDRNTWYLTPEFISRPAKFEQYYSPPKEPERSQMTNRDLIIEQMKQNVLKNKKF